MVVSADPFDIPLATLRRRRSAKWTLAPDGSLPAWVAEMDVTLAPAVASALHDAGDLSDTGYAGDDGSFVAAFGSFASARWGWQPAPERCLVFADLSASGSSVLTQLAGSDGRVAFTPPVYNAFYSWLAASGLQAVEVPLVDVSTGGKFDLSGMASVLASGVRVILLSHPHNPTGRVWTADELAAVADLAESAGATVVSDEIHAPLTYPGVPFTPFLTVSPAARRVGVALHSASKAFNLAGLKASVVVTDPAGPSVQHGDEDAWGVGLFGLLAGEAAFRDGTEWLDAVASGLAARAEHIRSRLADSPIGYQPPTASFLAWLDFRSALPGDDDPAATILSRTGLFLSSGPTFGTGGAGFARLNFATSWDLLDDALDRVLAAVS